MARINRPFYPPQTPVNWDSQKVGVNNDELKLRTLPPNSLGVGSFYGSHQIHTLGENSKALFFALTGDTLDANYLVGLGHQHQTKNSALTWLQLSTYPFVNSSATVDDIEDALCIRTTALTKRAAIKLVIPNMFINRLVTRLKLSIAPSPSATVNINILLKFYTDGGSLVLTLPFTVSTSRAVDREWFELPPQRLSALLGYDANYPLTICYAALVGIETSMSANTEFLYIHEISFGGFDL